jgi:cobyrinic acid a,c-diamide synthase
MAILIAGTHSGVGKTTITLALLAWLKKRGLTIQSFKVGPDYIDPMFHRRITGRPCRNLDPFLTSESYVTQCFQHHSQGSDGVVIEGVMGLFDGRITAGSTTPRADVSVSGRRKAQACPDGSSAHVAVLLGVPVLLVVDASKMGQSVAALALGFKLFNPHVNLAGVILNRVGSARHEAVLVKALEEIGLTVYGTFYRADEVTLPDRHLGLVPVGELGQFTQIEARLAHLAETYLYGEKLLPLIQTIPNPRFFIPETLQKQTASISIGIAQDQAFNFYYQDNLDILEGLGATLVPFSPMLDEKLPPGIQGLYLGGGFPEIFAEQLAANIPLKNQLKNYMARGLPVYAECGGLMYLSESILDFQEKAHLMLGVLPTQVRMGTKLTLGYREAIAQQDSYLVQLGQTIRGHEFHRSSLQTQPNSALYHFQEGTREGWSLANIHASYLHVHWGKQLAMPQRWLKSISKMPESIP